MKKAKDEPKQHVVETTIFFVKASLPTKKTFMYYTWYGRVPEIILHWREEAFELYRKMVEKTTESQRVVFEQVKKRPKGSYNIVYPTAVGAR